MDIYEKHIVVTGGSKGIGAALAHALHKKGARLTLLARKSDALVQTAKATGARAIEADLSDRSVLGGMIRKIEDQSGPIDVLVNNAGIGHTRHYVTLTDKNVEDTINTNLLAPMELTRQVLPGMLHRNSGQIINVSSVTGEFAVPGCTVYATTKAGLTMFSHTVQRDVRASAVNIAVVILGAVAGTQIYEEGTKSEVVRKLAEQLNSVSGITPGEVAEKLIKAIEDGKRGALSIPWSSAIPTAIRNLPLHLGDLVFLRGAPLPDPDLERAIKLASDQQKNREGNAV